MRFWSNFTISPAIFLAGFIAVQKRATLGENPCKLLSGKKFRVILQMDKGTQSTDPEDLFDCQVYNRVHFLGRKTSAFKINWINT